MRRWLIEDWMPSRRVTGLYCPGAEGKTTILHQLQTAAALRERWLGRDVAALVSLGLFCEDDDEEMHIRQDRINRHYRCDYQALAAVNWKARLGDDNLLMKFGSRNGTGELTKFWHELPRRSATCMPSS